MSFKPPSHDINEDLGPPAFADGTDRHPTDARLRRAGFKIHSRPRQGDNIWSYHGVLFEELEAIDFANTGTVPVVFDVALGRYRRVGKRIAA